MLLFIRLRFLVIFRSKLKREEAYIVAKEALSRVQDAFGEELHVLNSFPGSLLAGKFYVNPLFRDFGHPLLKGSHVTMDRGSGLVHTSFAHGFEDYQIAIENGLEVKCFVDDEGLYTRELGPLLSGKSVIEDASSEVLNLLRKHVLSSETLTHSYPYDWRSKVGLIIQEFYKEVFMCNLKILKSYKNIFLFSHIF